MNPDSSEPVRSLPSQLFLIASRGPAPRGLPARIVQTTEAPSPTLPILPGEHVLRMLTATLVHDPLCNVILDAFVDVPFKLTIRPEPLLES